MTRRGRALFAITLIALRGMASGKPLSVGVIGGGISGLSFARALPADRFSCTVYDTGKRGVGGRASSRSWGGAGAADHAAQFFLARDPRFQAQVKLWEAEGAVREWRGPVGRVSAERGFEEFHDGTARYIGSPERGLGAIAAAMADGVEVREDQWISPSGGLRKLKNGRWSVRAKGREVGQHDLICIAHNGKCAERIAKGTPAERLRRLLAVKFNDKCPRGGGSRMTLNALYSVLVQLPEGAAGPFEGAMVEGSDSLAWMSNNSRKYGAAAAGGGDVWTLLSTPSFAKAHKVPQEFLAGTETEALVVDALVGEALRVCGAGDGGGDGAAGRYPFKAQLWGAGVPCNVWRAEDRAASLWDAEHGIGAVGDWLWQPSIEGAWLSGLDLAEHLSAAVGQTRGFDGRFVASAAAGIGDVGGVGDGARQAAGRRSAAAGASD